MKRIFIFFLLFGISRLYSQSGVVYCDNEYYPPSRVLIAESNFTNFTFSLVNKSDEVRNICNDDFEYVLLFQFYNSGSTPLSLNYTITIDPQYIESYSTAHEGFNSFNLSTNTGTISKTINENEIGCARIYMSLPQETLSSSDIVNHSLQITVHNNTTNTPTNFNTGDFFSWLPNHPKFEIFDYITGIETVDNINPQSFYFVENELIVNEDFAFYSSNNPSERNRMYFAEDTKISVNEDIEFDISNMIFGSCGDKWEGIIVDENSDIICDNTDGFNAKTFLKLHNSNLEIGNSKIYNSDTGVHIYGSNSTVESFTNNTFENLGIGLYLSGVNNISISPPSNKPNMFRESDKGIFAAQCTDLEIMNNEFEDIDDFENPIAVNGGIVSVLSNSLIANNVFSNSGIGISSHYDKVQSITENNFVDNNIGVRLWKNNGFKHVAVNNIEGVNGIIGYFQNNLTTVSSNVPITHESFDNSRSSVGIQDNFGTGSLYVLNTINSSDAAAGIEFNDNSDVTSAFNTINLLTQNKLSGIAIEGASGSIVYGNTIDATQSGGEETWGIFSSASGKQQIGCNVLDGVEEGIVIKDNTMGPIIATNQLESTAIGINLEYSAIQTQTHTGNLFNGPFSNADIYADKMEEEDYENSKFIVDGNENSAFVPEEVVEPSGSDLVDDENNPAATEDCSGTNIVVSSNTKLLALCNYINAIKNSTTINALRKKSLLSSYYRLIKKYHPNSLTWSECVVAFMNSYNNTNIQKQNSVQEKKDAIMASRPLNNTNLENYKDALEDYLVALANNNNVSATRASFKYYEDLLSAEVEDRTSQEQTLLSDIETVLDNFTASDDYDELWLTVQYFWLKAYNDEVLDDNEKALLEEIAGLCPVEFGENIYSARAIVGLYSQKRFDDGDCIPSDERSRKGDILSNVNSFLYPNPTNGILKLNLPIDYKYNVSIKDIAGKTVYQKENITSIENIDANYLINGLYFLTYSNGVVTVTEKFIKVE